MKTLTALVALGTLVASPALAATRPSGALPGMTQTVRASTPAKKANQIVGVPLIFIALGVAAVVTTVVVVADNGNASNG